MAKDTSLDKTVTIGGRKRRIFKIRFTGCHDKRHDCLSRESRTKKFIKAFNLAKKQDH